jgi:hypothetical protein
MGDLLTGASWGAWLVLAAIIAAGLGHRPLMGASGF